MTFRKIVWGSCALFLWPAAAAAQEVVQPVLAEEPQPAEPLPAGAPETVAAPLPAPPPPAAAPAPSPDAGWPYAFTEQQRADLAAAGATFDEAARAVAQRMQSRGFTSDEYVAAFVESRAYAGVHTAAADVMVEDVAAFRLLGLPMEEFDAFESRYNVRPGRVTGYYNSRFGGRGAKIAGGILLGLGLFNLAGGIVFIAARDGLAEAYGKERVGGYTDYWLGAGIACAAIGGVMTLVGIPLLAVGASKTRRWAPAGLLDRGDVDELRRYRLAPDGAPAGVALLVTPIAAPDVRGLGLTLGF